LQSSKLLLLAPITTVVHASASFQARGTFGLFGGVACWLPFLISLEEVSSKGCRQHPIRPATPPNASTACRNSSLPAISMTSTIRFSPA
jgi:hypothetical protein